MTGTLRDRLAHAISPKQVKRRWHNLQWARAGVDRFIDENGTEYTGAAVDDYLNRAAGDGQ